MKKLVAFLLSAAVLIFSLTGCSGQSQAESPEPISAGMLAPEVYDAMREEWASYDALSPEQQMVSSYFPGICHESFSDWAACEEYLGIPVPNPLEEAAWLEHGAHTGESAGSQAPRMCRSLCAAPGTGRWSGSTFAAAIATAI